MTSPDPMCEALKPCPFCGNAATYEDYSQRGNPNPKDNYEQHHVRCSLPCRGYASYAYKSEALAITAWNTRALSADPSGWLSADEAKELRTLVVWAANPAATARDGYRVTQGWNVILEKLELIMGGEAQPVPAAPGEQGAATTNSDLDSSKLVEQEAAIEPSFLDDVERLIRMIGDESQRPPDVAGWLAGLSQRLSAMRQEESK